MRHEQVTDSSVKWQLILFICKTEQIILNMSIMSGQCCKVYCSLVMNIVTAFLAMSDDTLEPSREIVNRVKQSFVIFSSNRVIF